MFTELLKQQVKPLSARARSLGALAALRGCSECMEVLSGKRCSARPKRARSFPWSAIRSARLPTPAILLASFVPCCRGMRGVLFTSRTRGSVPGAISRVRFLPNPAANPFRFFPLPLTRPLDLLAARIIRYCLRPVCTHSEFVPVPGKKHCARFSKKKAHSQYRKSDPTLASILCYPGQNRALEPT